MSFFALGQFYSRVFLPYIGMPMCYTRPLRSRYYAD